MKGFLLYAMVATESSPRRVSIGSTDTVDLRCAGRTMTGDASLHPPCNPTIVSPSSPVSLAVSCRATDAARDSFDSKEIQKSLTLRVARPPREGIAAYTRLHCTLHTRIAPMARSASPSHLSLFTIISLSLSLPLSVSLSLWSAVVWQ